MKLDGNKENDWTSYCQTMAQVKAWFMSNGTAVDVSELVGEEKYIHVVPDNGTFHLTLTHGGESVDLIIDAREAWLKGEASPDLICEFNSWDSYISHEFIQMVKDCNGSYSSVAPDHRIELIPVGNQALLEAFRILKAGPGADIKGELVSSFEEACGGNHSSLLLKGMQGNPLEYSPLSKNEIFSMEYSRISNK